MASTKYTYPVSDLQNGKLAAETLQDAIRSREEITKALDGINVYTDGVPKFDIVFKDQLDSAEKIALDGGGTQEPVSPPTPGSVVGDHDGETFKPEAAEVIVREEVTKTAGGHYQSQSFAIEVPAVVGWHDLDFSFPLAISLLSAESFCKAENDGDQAKFLVAPDTVIGAITADANVAVKTINVQQSVVDNIEVGYCVALNDGTDKRELGRCLSIDDANNQILVETAPDIGFLAATPTFVEMSVEMVRNLELLEGQRITLGESKIGGTFMPSGTPFRLRYNNRDGQAKRFAFFFEYLY